MTGISNRLEAVKRRIHVAAQRCGRDPASIRLLAVSKMWPVSAIEEAIEAGQYAFGENYLQEGLQKIAVLDIHPRLEWHFIGPLQSNKTRQVAEYFDWVHAVDRLKIAQRLSEQRPQAKGVLNICIQVNVSGETSKSGLAPDEVEALTGQIITLPRLQLRGLMTIPEPSEDEVLLRRRFASLRTLGEALSVKFGIELDTLSMGMSQDLEMAVAEGATIVRIGTAIFGERSKNIAIE